MKMLTVADVMSADVVTGREETPYKELVRTMARHGISGIPILTGDPPTLAGIVTEADLLRVEAHERPPRSLFLELFMDRERLEEIERLAEDIRASDVMTRDVVTVGPSVSIQEAARRMIHYRVKRLPVVAERGRLVGIVCRSDLLRPFLRPDGDIGREIEEDLLMKTMWLDPGTVSVTVSGGVVLLSGEVDLRSSSEILEELVRRVPGVVGVDNTLTYRHDDRKVAGPSRPTAPDSSIQSWAG
jgi:CBS-domain-containing membrane protein